MKKLSVLFAVFTMLMLFALSASALNSTGQCGDNVKWSFNESDGKLVISGSGDMTDYDLVENFSPFMGKSDIKTVVVEKGVTSVGSYAFTFCRGIINVTLPDSVTILGEGAFANCANVKSLTLGKSVRSIGALAFDNCDGITKLNLPNTVTFIGEEAFKGCDGLTEVNLGDGVKELKFTFADCKNLKKVTFGKSLENIGEQAFSGCASLQNVTIPGTVTDIGKSAFQGCKSLTEIAIPKSVENIGETAFYECDSLKKFTVDSGNVDYSADGAGVLYNKKKTELIQYPIGKTDANYTIASSTESIGDYAFANCSALVNVTIPKGVTYVGNYAFYGCAGIKNLTLPESVTVIGDAAFYDCDSFTEFTIPQGVTTVGNNAFGYCDKLKKLSIPVSVTSLGDSVLAICDEFKEINYRGSEAQWQDIKKGVNNDILEGAKINYNVAPPQVDTHTHSYTSSVTKEPTCKEEGVRTFSCSCGDYYTEKIPTISHDISETVIKADFESDGMRSLKCKNCAYVVSEEAVYKVDTVKLLTEKYTYDGKTKTPGVFLEDVWGTDLKEGVHYTVEYETGRKNPGKYKVTITLTGEREGKKTLYFSILPGKTTKITATQSTSAIKLTWSKVTGAAGYRVYQYNTKTEKYEKIKDTTGTSYTISKLKAGTTYKFAVKAYTKDDGSTLWADSYATFKACTKPANPAPTASSSGSSATIKWSKVTGATGYVIYMQDSFGDYNKIASTKSTSYTKKSLKKGKTYYFRVRAYKTLDGKNIYGGYKTVKVKVK